MSFSLIAALALASGLASASDAGPLVRALWLIQRYGTAEAVDLANDQRIKGVLFKALGKEGELALSELGGFMDPETFKSLAGSDGRIGPQDIKHAVDGDVPQSRVRLLPSVREHADTLTTSFDMVDQAHRLAGGKLVDWIAKNYRPGTPLNIIVVCTGNSRRSILGATMGNIAADYYGMPEIRFHSGGTAPTAFNSRTVNTLKAMGVEIEATGKEAARGEPETANPVYRIRWGSPSAPGGTVAEATEFSKRYDDSDNPQAGFAALMVCGEADAGCPFVKGAALRVSMPYLDPKIYDGGAYETAKYAERRDDIGRLMLATMMQARQRIASAAASKVRGNS
jgi:arsenate reductase (thioredoxin)